MKQKFFSARGKNPLDLSRGEVNDCQSVPITRLQAACAAPRAVTSKKVKGRKRHVVTDTQGGWTWAVGVHPANEHESQPRALDLLFEADAKSERLAAVFADKAYRGSDLEDDLKDDLKESCGMRLEITEPDSDEPGFSVEPKR